MKGGGARVGQGACRGAPQCFSDDSGRVREGEGRGEEWGQVLAAGRCTRGGRKGGQSRGGLRAGGEGVQRGLQCDRKDS